MSDKLTDYEKNVIDLAKKKLSDYGDMLSENERLKHEISFYDSRLTSLKSAMANTDEVYASSGAKDDSIIKLLDKKMSKEKRIEENLAAYCYVEFVLNMITDETEKRILREVWIEKKHSIPEISRQLHLSYTSTWRISKEVLIRFYEDIESLKE